MSEQPQEMPVFTIEKIFLKDMSVEVPNAPMIYLEQTQPHIEMNIDTRHQILDNAGVYQCVLSITVTANLGDKTAFLVEVQQGGVFRIQNVPQEAIEPMLAVACPNILYPYAREAVSDAVMKTGFPPLYLQPMNFEALYMQRQAQQAGGAAQG